MRIGAAGGSPSPGGDAPNSAGGASAGSGVTAATERPARPERARGGRGHGGRHDRLDEDVDRAAAGEADVPGLLVADPVADHSGVAGPAGTLDLLRGGALDATAADRAHEPAVVGDEEDCALGPGRRAERPDDDRAAGTDALRAPGRRASSAGRACAHRTATINSVA